MSLKNATRIKQYLDDGEIPCCVKEFRYDGRHKYYISVDPSRINHKISVDVGYSNTVFIRIEFSDEETFFSNVDKYYPLGYRKMFQKRTVEKKAYICDKDVIKELQSLSRGKCINIKKAK